jgi:four helix bundle protein
LIAYQSTNNLPKEETLGLTSQIRRAAVSVPSNIIEDKARGSNKDYKRFLLMARGSLKEIKYQLLLAKDLKYIDEIIYKETMILADETGKMLNKLV